MSIDLNRLSPKELDALISQAKKRKTTLSKRKPIALVRRKLTQLAKAEGYGIDELFGGKAVMPLMGCYGIGVSRIVAAAIEQNHDDAGILWPEAMAPWQVAVCIINPKSDPAVSEAAQALYAQLNAAGIDAVLDDRGLRPGPMFADIELIGIPHRVVVSERGLAAGTFEYRARNAAESEQLDRGALLVRLGLPH